MQNGKQRTLNNQIISYLQSLHRAIHKNLTNKTNSLVHTKIYYLIDYLKKSLNS